MASRGTARDRAARNASAGVVVATPTGTSTDSSAGASSAGASSAGASAASSSRRREGGVAERGGAGNRSTNPSSTRSSSPRPTPRDHPEQSSTCLVCGSESAGEPVLEGAVGRCPSCGFGWTVGELAGAPESQDDWHPGRGDDDPFMLRRRRFEASRRLRWLLSLARPRSLVEAGPAGGFFVEAARRVGIDASGIEASTMAARFARQRLGVPVVEGRFESLAPARHVDAVCAFHVLEHVEDPRVFLEAAREALVPGGWLALEVPNLASAGARRAGSGWHGPRPEHQRWQFTPESLMRLVMQSGFHIVQHDTALLRYYLPARYRWRHAHRLLPSDWSGTGSFRRTHPRLGDLLRVVARLPRNGRRIR